MKKRGDNFIVLRTHTHNTKHRYQFFAQNVI